jgi:hypothetical protein
MPRGGRRWSGENPMLGRHHTPEARRLISQAHLGKPKSEETKEKMRKARLEWWAKRREEDAGGYASAAQAGPG